jgi:peptide/nickel transport system permease protein
MEFWIRYRRNRSAVVAAWALCILAFVAVSYPWLTPYNAFSPVAESLLPPSYKHWMGTDDLGRDVLSGVLEGTRVSLVVGFCSAITSAFIGIFVGALAGFFGKSTDIFLMRITEMFQIIPVFLLALLIVAVFGASLWFVILVIGILSWPSTARIVRAEFLTLKERDFVAAAKASGFGQGRIIFREILPNALPPVIVNVSMQIASAILIEAGLSYMGLSDPELMSWGKMMFIAQTFLRRAPWMAVFPGLMVSITTLTLNLVGDGLNDATNPLMDDR